LKIPEKTTVINVLKKVLKSLEKGTTCIRTVLCCPRAGTRWRTFRTQRYVPVAMAAFPWPATADAATAVRGPIPRGLEQQQDVETWLSDWHMLGDSGTQRPPQSPRSDCQGLGQVAVQERARADEERY